MRSGEAGCRWRPVSMLCLVFALAGCLVTGAETLPRSLRVVSHAVLPELRSIPTDIRWAGDDSVYVAWSREGVFEIGLDGSRRRQPVPSPKTLGRFEHFNQLAVTSKDLAVGSINWYMAWRPRASAADGQVTFQRKSLAVTHDLDLWNDRMLFLGIPDIPNPFASGAIAWLGRLSSRIEDLKPVLYDVQGAGAKTFYRCEAYELGAVRFLADGSFVVVPGFQKGVHLFAPNGEKRRSWTSEELGLNSDCTGMSDEEGMRIQIDPVLWQRWLNAHRVVDDILSLPQGPGLLVRSVGEDGRARWELKVLTANRVRTYAVPVLGRRPLDRLRGDVRDGRIVLLLSASGFNLSPDPADHQGEILLAEAPND